VVWEDGERETLSIHKRGYFGDKDVGDTLTIGDLGRYKSGRSFASEERPPALGPPESP
jgi:hypothetical protein